MTFWQKIASYAIAIVVSLGVGFGTAWLVKSCHKTIIEVVGVDSLRITQQARIGYITLDSAKALIVSESKIKWILRDSVIIRDSLSITDSIVYIPIYEANDSIITLLDSLGYIVKVGLKQRFLPIQERFASDVWLSQLEVPSLEESPAERIYERIRVGLGVGTRFDEHCLYAGISYYIVNSSWFDIKTSLRGEYNKAKDITPEVTTEIGIKF